MQPTRRTPRAFASVLLAACAAGGMCGGCQTAAPAPRVDQARERQVAAMTHIDLANDAVRTGDIEKALAEFERAIAINPNLSNAHLGKGDIYRTQGDYDRAAEAYGGAVRADPRNFDAQYYHGLMLHLLDRVTDAIQAYLRALTLRPNDFKTNLNLATAYNQLDENRQALTYASRAVTINPRDGPSRYLLGVVYQQLERHQEAVRELQQATELMPLSSQLLLRLSESLGRLERHQEMANALDQVLKVEPTADAYERLGFARFKLGQYDPAKTAFQYALDLDPNHYPSMNGLGVSLLNDWIRSAREDQVAKRRGIDLLRRSLQIRPDQPKILELVTRYGK